MTNNANDARTKLMVVTAMVTALTTIATTFFKIPLPVGYIHLGDTMVILAALFLPVGYACFAAGFGCALADIIGGYAVWAPWTIVAKVAMVLLVAFFIKKYRYSDNASNTLKIALIVAFILAIIANIAVYYVAEGVIYGSWIAPVAGIPTNAVQGGVGVLIALLISKAIPKNIF